MHLEARAAGRRTRPGPRPAGARARPIEGVLEQREDRGGGAAERGRGSRSPGRWAVNSAAVTSPEPFAFIGSSGVCTIQAPSSVTASISIGVGRSVVVLHAGDQHGRAGPSPAPASAEARISSSVCGSVPVRKPSSNWLGVMMSAVGTTGSRRNAGMSGCTKQPLPALPITGSQVYDARGLAALHPRHRVEDHVGDVGAALVAGEHGVHLAEHPALLDAGDHVRDVAGRRAAGRARRRTRCGWRSAPWTPARPRGRAAAAGTRRRSCRRGRRRPRTGWTGTSPGDPLRAPLAAWADPVRAN